MFLFLIIIPKSIIHYTETLLNFRINVSLDIGIMMFKSDWFDSGDTDNDSTSIVASLSRAPMMLLSCTFEKGTNDADAFSLSNKSI